ncbi:efflux RND transporter periplasmic adaptor subunit [Streptomyces sp. H27-D2]|uniref:efflux RND transporter periplasmic adaptor subunit n=1 Tax=Streptomyces sp. H27-D2 TaxID=3046304 RepID=UPI002DC00719|nr:efflux RND transporter periplasmic adaptor subunit [Streptomyces sp. H27-D2]MEC4017991.1 efflux RND transporter periplasmic adaptor subunit [Streptomyces sp. H27-D2]
MTRARRLGVVAIAVVLAGGGASITALGLGGPDPKSAAERSTLPPATTKISKSDLMDAKSLPGELGYGDAVPVGSGLQGTVTWLPKVGSVVTRGETLYKVDNRPVTLIYGDTPVYRALKTGDKGPDVKQLNDNLRALGYDAPDSSTYTARTASAVRGLQEKQGVKETGEVEKGRIVFVPDAIRVSAHKAAMGDPAAAHVLAGTGREKAVIADLEVSDQGVAKKGDPVEVVLPGGKSVKGRITDVETGTPPPKDDGAGSGSGDSGGEKPKTKIRVKVEISDQEKLKGLDAATVDVKFISATAKDALSVPVTALVALPKGGYGVEVVEGGTTRIVPVELGLFAQDRVQITGKRLREGMTVGMPE